MNKYEAMIIFPESLKDEALEASLEKVRGEITKLEGKVQSATRLGRRPFARRLKKQTAGHYFVVTFEFGGDKISQLQARLKLNEEIFRIQIVKQNEAQPAAAAATAGE